MTQVSSLYLHIPFCRHLCNYCDFYKKRFDAPVTQIESFHQFLTDSMLRHEQLLQEYQVSWSPLETIYLGGGTPSLWGEAGAEYFANNIRPVMKLAEACEFTMEIDPGTWNAEMIEAWRQLGLNRISIGTQTLNPHFLKIMDRSHNLEESFALLKYCQDHAWNFSLDFLLGLPYSREKKRDIEEELRELLKYQPKHISLYILNARSKYPHAQKLPDDEFIREEYLLVSELLRAEGFHHYEVSNFALPGFESQHNIKYWQSESVAALGPTGTGLFKLNSHEAIRYKWKVSQAQPEIEKLSESELELERTYLELRTSRGWRPQKLLPELVALFDHWTSLKYGEFHHERYQLNSLGFLMLDSLMDDLFRLPALR
jgi:oxygen-independent coproporphyrinogen-3 oxidase